MRVIIAICTAAYLLADPVLGQQKKYWTTFLIQNREFTSTFIPSKGLPPPLETSRCTVALDQKTMESELDRVNWPPKTSKPTINWKEDIPVIIAPAEAELVYGMTFIDLNWTGSEFILRWGWWNPNRKEYRGSSTRSFGMGSQPKHQILVVVVKRYVYERNKLICQEYDAG